MGNDKEKVTENKYKSQRSCDTKRQECWKDRKKKIRKQF